jgi:hypothetical protein
MGGTTTRGPKSPTGRRPPLREAPLKPLSPIDVQLPRNPETKATTDALLHRLSDLGFSLPDDAAAYLSQSAPLQLHAAMAQVARRRPGRSVRIPGRPAGPSRASRWEIAFEALNGYVAEFGHARVPDKTHFAGLKLGGWVSRQRAEFRDGTLATDRATRLQSLPMWSWNPARDAWDEGYACLVEFQEREGHLHVPVEHVESGFPLGSWMRSYRRPRGRRSLSGDQRRRLEALPGWSVPLAPHPSGA